jgi:hypothetical protein
MTEPNNMPDSFDRTLGSLEGLPDVVQVKATTVRVTTPLLGKAQTFIVQTIRQRDVGDFVFLEYVDAEGSTRMVIPPKVTEVIARHRDAIGARIRSRAAKAKAADRKARGLKPGYMMSPAAERRATVLVTDGSLRVTKGRKKKRASRRDDSPFHPGG